MDSRVRLSQCMIVKNEENNIRRALSWGKSIMWEQIVVDTGSTDRTVEIAKSMGAKVFHFEWNDDFSAAKNYALEHASGNWIAFLDADEYLNSENVDKIWKILRQVEEKLQEKDKPHILRCSLADLTEDGRVMNVTVQDRFFRNLPQLRYSNRIHEKVGLTEGGTLLIAGIEEDVTVLHTGYTKTAYKETGKTERNIRLLEKELLERPDDYRTAVYLAESLDAGGRFEEAEELYRRILREGFDRLDRLHKNHVLQDLMRMLLRRDLTAEDGEFAMLYQTGCETDSALPDYDYMMGQRECRRGRWRESVGHLDSALQKLQWYKGETIVYMAGQLEEAYSMLVKAYLEMNQENQAMKYVILTLKANKKNESMLCVLLDLLRKDVKKNDTGDGALAVLSKLYDLHDLRDQVLVMRAAKTVDLPGLILYIKQLVDEDDAARQKASNP